MEYSIIWIILQSRKKTLNIQSKFLFIIIFVGCDKLDRKIPLNTTPSTELRLLAENLAAFSVLLQRNIFTHSPSN